jgi:hypothetical protein
MLCEQSAHLNYSYSQYQDKTTEQPPKPRCSDCGSTNLTLTPYTCAGTKLHICRACLADCRAEGNGPS